MSEDYREEREREQRLVDEASRNDMLYSKCRGIFEESPALGVLSDSMVDRLALAMMRLIEREVKAGRDPLQSALDAALRKETSADRNFGEAADKIELAMSIIAIQRLYPSLLKGAPVKMEYLVPETLAGAQKALSAGRINLDVIPF